MSKENLISSVAYKLVDRGMDMVLARKNLLECDMYFIEELDEILK